MQPPAEKYRSQKKPSTKKEGSQFKIFVGGIPPALKRDDLNFYFSQFGQILKIDLPVKKGRRGKEKLRGFAFIHFLDQESVDHVLGQYLNRPENKKANGSKDSIGSVSHDINGSIVAVRQALDSQKASKLTKELQKLKLYVKNLPLDATSKEITKFFSRFGPVNRVQMTVNSSSKEFRGFAYVIINNKESFDKILDLFKANHSQTQFDLMDQSLLFRGVHVLEVDSSLSLTEVNKKRVIKKSLQQETET
jgi:RNA recognition motif-containing protein